MSKKNRNRVTTIWDLGRVPVSEVPRENSVGSLRQFQADEARREQEAAVKAEQESLQAIEQARLTELTSPASQRIAKYFRQELKEQVINGLDMTPVDHFGDYEIGPRGDNEKEAATWREFRDNLKSSGCNLSDLGGERLGWFLCSLAYHRGVSLTSVRNWQTALTRLHSLDVFQPGELAGYQPQTSSRTSSQPEPERPAVIDPLDELESLSLESRAGNLRAKEIVNGLVGNEERAAWFKFIEQFRRETGHDLTHAEGIAIFNMMKHRGLDFRNPKHLRMVVVALCKTGELPAEKILVEQEKLDIFIEASDLSDIAVRREVNRRQRVINETAERKRLGV